MADTNTPIPRNTKPVPGGTFVLVEFDDGIAWVSMNRPEKRNAISPALAFEMIEVLDALEIDDRCGVIVLTGSGESWSAGMDLKEYFRATDKLSYDERMRVYRANGTWQWKMLRNYAKPTIAMVNGWCFGGAFTPMIACDLAIAADEATFGLSEINWGIIPAGVVTKAVADVIRQRDALYYIMTGEPFDGKRAAEIGLVNQSVPAAQLRERTAVLARQLLSKNPFVLRQAKLAYHVSRDMPWEQAAEYLTAKADQTRALDPEKGQDKGMAQFIDEKSYRPGLGEYSRNK
ncbi:p-hydroxycinnamoyl CoA hydratase/lyase [Massilia cavernae]|uniref:p-hydroxycinnamoyl CoA hydratase/lyase n=1 Tax=Massilia cavernae TaxID=2320864 RepID=A0A418Y5S7_9BURK|nr:p-hydroxycinnamoyl CoA hydratase/lyase [Massilia cavernae]RJG22070.1 p-hydroxycinnamoyl CoA hydratase/lyase [Massilia cavernae]